MAQSILLAASYDLKVHAYEFSSGNQVDEYEIANSQANRIISTQNDNRFYVAAYSYILAYDLYAKSKKPAQAIVAHESNVTDICVTPTTLISCGEDKMIKSWDRRTGQGEQTITTKDSLNSILLMPNGYEVIVGCESGTIAIWDARNSACQQKVSASKSPVRSLSMSPDNSCFVAACMDGSTLSYKIDGSSFTEHYRLQAHNEATLRCCISPNSELFATSAADNTAKIWQLSTGDLKQSLVASESRDWIWDIAFTPDSLQLCTGCSGGFCRVWDVENGRMVLAMRQLEKCVSAICIVTPK